MEQQIFLSDYETEEFGTSQRFLHINCAIIIKYLYINDVIMISSNLNYFYDCTKS